jgi:hypothetical protein
MKETKMIDHDMYLQRMAGCFDEDDDDMNELLTKKEEADEALSQYLDQLEALEIEEYTEEQIAKIASPEKAIEEAESEIKSLIFSREPEQPCYGEY